MNLIAPFRNVVGIVLTGVKPTTRLQRWNRWTRLLIVGFTLVITFPKEFVVSATETDTNISFSISSAVSTEDASYVTEGLRMAQRYVSTTLSEFSEPVVINVRGTADTTGAGAVAFSGGPYIVVFTGSPGWTGLAPFDRVHVVAHEYIHAWQHALLGDAINEVPAWIIEGMAEYLAYDAIAQLGLVGPATVHDFHAWSVKSSAALSGLSDLEDGSAFYAEHGPVNSLAFLAIEQLLPDASPDALVQFLKQIRLGHSWQSAFCSTFGQTTEQFYQEMETAQESLIAPVRVPLQFAQVFPIATDSDITIGRMAGSAIAGAQILVKGQSDKGAICQFQLSDSGSSPDAVGTTFADASGQLFWLVTVPTTIEPGPARIEAGCGGDDVTIELEIFDAA